MVSSHDSGYIELGNEKSLGEMSRDDFLSKYDGFSQLLVRLRDNTVVGAIRKGGREDLLNSAPANLQAAMHEYGVYPGPAPLKEIEEGYQGFRNRIAGGEGPRFP
ncbi:hypothetical protein [Planctomyces sp. SH-PL14]|uniref:hypothetical protein n=1 Tax=Planctomyces sp. SH-PL14 TaxID=1632864 RepID=UPI00078B214F|nr:hypothetical protein [Planctomyces sp. SH-PL14]AMV18568.1 hypothetical protein VT03_11795 [Planctomyces sp. SH-PL14]